MISPYKCSACGKHKRAKEGHDACSKKIQKKYEPYNKIRKYLRSLEAK